MADFLQANPQQDPEALRRAMLLKMFGGMPPGPPGTAPAAPGVPPTSMTPAGGPDAGKPAAQPLATAANANGGTPQPDNKAPAPVLSEADWQKQNPAAPHTPYVAPSFKQRLLEGLFAGMQEFGRPGEGAHTIQNYLGDIQKNEEAEKNYGATSAADAHKKYMDYAQGQEVPLQLQNLQAQIAERQANAKAKLNPPQKLQHFVIDDPAKPGQPKAVDFDQTTGAYLDPDTKQAIPGAKAWEAAANKKEPATLKYDNGIPTGITANGVTYDIHDPNLPAELKPLVQSGLAAHKQFLDEQAARETRAEKRGKEKEERTATRQEITAHDRAYVKPAEDVEKSFQMMDGAYREYQAAKAQGKELPTGAQGMLALSSHLQTTFGNVKGARVTKEMIQHHLGARSISDDAHVAFQKLTNGDPLSTKQWEAFHELIGNSRKLSWQTAVKEAGRKKIPVDFLPKDLEGLTGEGEAQPPAAGQPLPSFKDWQAKQGKP